jgi:RNA polymerase sigma factor (sigma-70 family)
LNEIEMGVDSNGPDMREIPTSLKEELRSLLVILPPRDQEVLKMRCGLGGDLPSTLEQVGMYFNVSREKIRQIEARARFMFQSIGLRNTLHDDAC